MVNETRAAKLTPTALVADDDHFLQGLQIELLQELGFTGVVVQNGQQALDCLATRSFDLVLLDVSMPVLDGLAALARLRQREAAHGLAHRQRVIMVTGHAEPGDIDRLLAAGADGYIAKPIQSEQFYGEIGRVMKL